MCIYLEYYVRVMELCPHQFVEMSVLLHCVAWSCLCGGTRMHASVW